MVRNEVPQEVSQGVKNPFVPRDTRKAGTRKKASRLFDRAEKPATTLEPGRGKAT